jgi:hypothetical protein
MTTISIDRKQKQILTDTICVLGYEQKFKNNVYLMQNKNKINLTLSSVLNNYNKTYYSISIRVVWDNTIDLIFRISYLNNVFNCEIYIYNIMTNILNFNTYNTNDEEELERKTDERKSELLEEIKNEVDDGYNIPSDIDSTDDVTDEIFKHPYYTDRYEEMLEEINDDSGIEDNITDDLFFQKTKIPEWMFEYKELPMWTDFGKYYFDPEDHNIYNIDILSFLNIFMKKYYDQNNYFNYKNNNDEWTVRKRYPYNVFIHKICNNENEYGKQYKHTLMYPVNFKKLRNICSVIKLIKNQMERSMKYIRTNPVLINAFNKKYNESYEELLYFTKKNE